MISFSVVKLYACLALTLALIVGAVWYHYHAIDIGERRIETSDKAASDALKKQTAAEDALLAEKSNAATENYFREQKAVADYVAAHPLPSGDIRVRSSASTGHCRVVVPPVATTPQGVVDPAPAAVDVSGVPTIRSENLDVVLRSLETLDSLYLERQQR